MAVHDHILILWGSSGKGAYSTDDGATFTDIGTGILDASTADTFTLLGDGPIAACTDGDRWLVINDRGHWTTSPDSVTWSISSNRAPMQTETHSSERSEDCIYVPARATPSPGSRRWNRWFMCGSASSNNDPYNLTGEIPAIAMVALNTSDPPLDGASTWTQLEMPAAIANRPIRWKSMAYDPVNFRFWVVGVAFDTGNVVLFYANQADLENASASFYIPLRDATAELPEFLRVGGNLFETLGYVPRHSVVLDYDWRSQCLRLSIRFDYDKFVSSYTMPCGVAYNTGAWEEEGRFDTFNFIWRDQFAGAYGLYRPHQTIHRGGANSYPMFGGCILIDGALARWTPESASYDDKVDDPTLAITTNAGSTVGAFVKYDAGGSATYDMVWHYCQYARFDESVDIDGTGMPTDEGWPTVLIQAPSAAVSTATGVTVPVCNMSWFAHTVSFGTSEIEVPTADVGAWTTASDEYGSAGTLEFTKYVTDTATMTDELTPAMEALSNLSDAFAMSSAIVDAVTYLLQSAAAFASTTTDNIAVGEQITDVLLMVEEIVLRFPHTLADSFNAADTHTTLHTFVGILADALSMTDGITDRHQALDVLADIVATESLLKVAPLEQVSDTAAMGETLASWRNAMATILDGLTTSDTMTVQTRVVLVCADTFAAADSLLSALQVVESIEDSFSFYVTFRIGDEVFRGYILNAANKAASEYTNFDFNSLAVLGDRLFLASSTGLYEQTGDDDDGEPIEAKVRTALVAIADGRMANVCAAYLGYTSDGTVVLKAIVTSPSGAKAEHWYRLTEQTSDAMREGRIKLGRGLKSAYWQFEVCNVAGADLSLDNIKLHRVTLDRRI